MRLYSLLPMQCVLGNVVMLYLCVIPWCAFIYFFFAQKMVECATHFSPIDYEVKPYRQ